MCGSFRRMVGISWGIRVGANLYSFEYIVGVVFSGELMEVVG